MPDTSGTDSAQVRLYLDCHVKLRLAEDLIVRGYDVLTSEAAGRKTASDAEQLEFAASEGRAVVTFNIRDFAPLHEQWIASGRQHAGIIVSQQLGGRQYGVLLGRMLRLLQHFSADGLRSVFVHMEQFR